MEEEDEQWLILSFLCIVHTLDYDRHLQSSNRTETQSLFCTKLSFTWDPGCRIHRHRLESGLNHRIIITLIN